MVFSDTLKCSADSCNHQSSTVAPFLNISVDVPDHLEGGYLSAGAVELQHLIKVQLAPEKLDEDNKWTCSGCNEKVCAQKVQEYQILPQLLMVHLKRFRFDPVRYDSFVFNFLNTYNLLLSITVLSDYTAVSY